MLRMIRLDLLCGFGGFVLGAAALLASHKAIGSAPPPPPTHTDVIALAGPAPQRADAG